MSDKVPATFSEAARRLLGSRRFCISVLALVCLTVLGVSEHYDVSMALAGVAAALSASNSYQKKGKVDGQESSPR